MRQALVIIAVALFVGWLVNHRAYETGRKAAYWDLSHMSPQDALDELREYRAAYDPER
jgi:hypothetical protein